MLFLACMYIDNNDDLQKLCSELDGAKEIFFDTEFMRERTYYPKLCLIQIGYISKTPSQEEGDGGGNYAIDPLAGMDLTPLLEKLVSRETLLIFHSGRQDLEIIFNEIGKLPENIFDTQIAAMVCGFGEQVSYAQLVDKFAGEKIDKSQRFTDWSKRPLSDKQIQYALNDVIYLPKIYEGLKTSLAEDGRDQWLTQEVAGLINPASYDEDPMETWKKIKSKGTRNLDLGVLQHLSAWRDLRARKVDKPRRFLIKDEVLVGVANNIPKNIDELKNFRGIGNVSRETLEKMMEAIAKGQATEEDDKPQLKARPRHHADGYVVDLLKLLLKRTCSEKNVAAKLIASSSDLEAFALGKEVKFSEGWRYDVFGKQAEALLNGEIKFSVKDNSFEMEEAESI